MKIITRKDIEEQELLTPAHCLAWVREAFAQKKSARLPHKISITYGEGNFMNTMPCMVPDMGVYGVKVVSRYPGRVPAIAGDILLYKNDGELLALMDGSAITSWRTGAVAALAVEIFAKSDFREIGVMGLGETAKCTLMCLSEIFAERPLTLHLLRYKDQAEKVKAYLSAVPSAWNIDIVETAEALVRRSDVVISCITYARELIAPDDAFRPGCLVVPVHTRGFQNCDLFFDKVYGDDTSHIEGFKYFRYFKRFAEMPSVLDGTAEGRSNDEERILSYNIGIALHDIVCAKHIYDALLCCASANKMLEIRR